MKTLRRWMLVVLVVLVVVAGFLSATQPASVQATSVPNYGTPPAGGYATPGWTTAPLPPTVSFVTPPAGS